MKQEHLQKNSKLLFVEYPRKDAISEKTVFNNKRMYFSARRSKIRRLQQTGKS